MTPMDYPTTSTTYMKHLFGEKSTRELDCDDNSPYARFIQQANADGYLTYKILESLPQSKTTRRAYELQLTTLGEMYVKYLLL